MGAGGQKKRPESPRLESHREELPKTRSSKSAGSETAPAAPARWQIAHDPELSERLDLTERYSVEVLHTTKGLLRGSWGQFRAGAFYRPLPGGAGDADEDVRSLRHILIKALDIIKYAERDGEVVEVDVLGEGSYSTVYGTKLLAAKVISDRERPWVHKAAVENALKADRLDLGPRIFGHGVVEQGLGGSFKATVVFMERLEPLGDAALTEADIRVLLSSTQRLSQVGFHNDLKLPNVLRRLGHPVIIDFDLMASWAVKVAVTANCIERDFQELLEPLGQPITWSFREYYDLFALSLTLEDGPLYRSVLRRLVELWGVLDVPVLQRLVEEVPQDKLLEIPYEVLVRVPLHGVTVNLLDLRGNLFAHLAEAGPSNAKTHLEQSLHLPQLARSNGVYWPDDGDA